MKYINYEIVHQIIESNKKTQEVLNELLELLERNNFTISDTITLFDRAIKQLTEDMEISYDKIRKYD